MEVTCLICCLIAKRGSLFMIILGQSFMRIQSYERPNMLILNLYVHGLLIEALPTSSIEAAEA